MKPVGLRGRKWPAVAKKKGGCIRTYCGAVEAVERAVGDLRVGERQK